MNKDELLESMDEKSRAAMCAFSRAVLNYADVNLSMLQELDVSQAAIDHAWKDYAKALEKPPLTRQEKQAAWMIHIKGLQLG